MADTQNADSNWQVAHVGETPAVAASTLKPGRFTLRELFILTALVCVAGGCYSWCVRQQFGLAAMLLIASAVATVLYAIHVFTRLSIGGVVAGAAMLACLAVLVVPAIQPSRVNSRRGACQNNLHNIALALQQYESAFGSFPPPYIADASGKPMHSWRVLLLPFLDQRNLYKLYRFDEPWDGPNNSKLHSTVLKIYSCPSETGNRPFTDTSYAVVVGPKTAWPEQPKYPIRMADITDGTSNTILVVEVHDSGIHWMEPRDLHISQMPMAINPPRGQGISSHHKGGAEVAFADGSVRFLTNDLSPKTLRDALTRSGKEPPGDLH